jgi:hypothetical protein
VRLGGAQRSWELGLLSWLPCLIFGCMEVKNSSNHMGRGAGSFLHGVGVPLSVLTSCPCRTPAQPYLAEAAIAKGPGICAWFLSSICRDMALPGHRRVQTPSRLFPCKDGGSWVMPDVILLTKENWTSSWALGLPSGSVPGPRSNKTLPLSRPSVLVPAGQISLRHLPQ